MADYERESREEVSNSKNVGELTITVNADMSDAITGFKALQRELRETTKVAREAEAAINALKEASE